MRLPLKSWLASLAFATVASPAAAQLAGDPIHLVVPFTPGTGIDMIARQVSPHLSEKLGRPIVVENKAGASGNIGTAYVVRAKPTGDTLLVTVNTVVMNASLFPDLPFNPVEDLDAVSLTSWGQLMLVASANSGIKSAQDLIKVSKARPGELNYGSPGNGTPHHLATELWMSRTDTDLTHIPYRGTGPALTDLLGGQIDVMFLPIHVALEHIKSGRIVPLAISSPEPNPLLPDVPPLGSLGFGEMEVDMWYGIMAPKGTPAATLDELNAHLKDILELPEIRNAFEAQGMTPAHSSPQEFGELMQRDAKRWADLIQQQGIKAE